MTAKAKEKASGKNLVRTTQSKFIAAMHDLAEKNRLEFIYNPIFANTGEIRFEHKEGFNALLSVRFSFDNSAGAAGFTGDYYKPSVKYSELSSAVTQITMQLREKIRSGA